MIIKFEDIVTADTFSNTGTGVLEFTEGATATSYDIGSGTMRISGTEEGTFAGTIDGAGTIDIISTAATTGIDGIVGGTTGNPLPVGTVAN